MAELENEVEVGDRRRPLKIAFLCFLPDWGHILPLMKIAHAAKQAGHKVRCYMPEVASVLAERAQIDVFPLTRQSAAEGRALGVLALQSLFFQNYSGYSHTNLFVYPGIVSNGLEELDEIIPDVQDFDPDLIVADYHVLSPLYEAISNICDVPFVRHNPSGTLAGQYRPFIRIYGRTRAGPFAMKFTEIAGALFQFFFRPAVYLRHLPAWLRARVVKRRLRERVAHIGRAPKVWSLTTGLTWIEEQFLGHSGSGQLDSQRADLPPLPSLPEVIPPQLDDWLRGSEGPVVYVSFGSILQLPDRTYREISESLQQIGCRVIWSTPVSEAAPLARLAKNPLFYVTRYVPQAELLKRREVGCFVTHAGAGSIQEALLGGTPVLCVPLHADNGFISWLVQRLKVGRRIWKDRLERANFAEALNSILSDDSFRMNADLIARRLQKARAQDQVVAFLERVALEAEV